jgi:hypothetical protein
MEDCQPVGSSPEGKDFMITWLASYPRSGNSFFRMVAKRSAGLEIYSIYEEASNSIDKKTLKKFRKAPELAIIKTHEFPTDNSPAIYLLRDGRDALVSYAWYSLSETGKGIESVTSSLFQNKLEELIMSDGAFGEWGRHVLAWISRPQTIVIPFEKLITAPVEIVTESLRTVGFDVKQTDSSHVPRFEELNAANPRIYRKGQIGGWKSDMPPHLHRLFWERHGEAMRAAGYSH